MMQQQQSVTKKKRPERRPLLSATRLCYCCYFFATLSLLAIATCQTNNNHQVQAIACPNICSPQIAPPLNDSCIAGAFGPFPTLIQLNSRGLTALDPLWFQNCNYSLIQLSHNAITEIPIGIFDPMSASLRGLYLSYACAPTWPATLPATFFDNLINLELLDLGALFITNLPAGIFDALSALTSIIIQNNFMTQLPPGLFQGKPGLQIINMRYLSRLTSLPAGLLDNLSVDYLALSNNLVSTLPAGFFDTLIFTGTVIDMRSVPLLCSNHVSAVTVPNVVNIDNCATTRTVQVDNCQSSPCLNGGTCSSFNDLHLCACAPGYIGLTCEIVDYCSPSPCLNGGNCTLLTNGYACECHAEFDQPDCTTPTSLLDSPFFWAVTGAGTIFLIAAVTWYCEQPDNAHVGHRQKSRRSTRRSLSSLGDDSTEFTLRVSDYSEGTHSELDGSSTVYSGSSGSASMLSYTSGVTDLDDA